DLSGCCTSFAFSPFVSSKIVSVRTYTGRRLRRLATGPPSLRRLRRSCTKRDQELRKSRYSQDNCSTVSQDTRRQSVLEHRYRTVSGRRCRYRRHVCCLLANATVHLHIGA